MMIEARIHSVFRNFWQVYGKRHVPRRTYFNDLEICCQGQHSEQFFLVRVTTALMLISEILVKDFNQI